MKAISVEFTQLKNIEQLDNVIDIQAMSELEKEIISLMQYYDNLKYRKGQAENELKKHRSNDVSKVYLDLYHQWES